MAHPVRSEEMRRYFADLEAGADAAYRIATEARRKGLDPSREVEIPKTQDLAARVAKEFAHRPAKTREEAIDRAVRVGLAILTEGILVAPLEGLAEVRVKRNADGTNYVDLSFAGPIRSAGGTGQALSVLIADVVRRDLGVGGDLPEEEGSEGGKGEDGGGR